MDPIMNSNNESNPDSVSCIANKGSIVAFQILDPVIYPAILEIPDSILSLRYSRNSMILTQP